MGRQRRGEPAGGRRCRCGGRSARGLPSKAGCRRPTGSGRRWLCSCCRPAAGPCATGSARVSGAGPDRRGGEPGPAGGPRARRGEAAPAACPARWCEGPGRGAALRRPRGRAPVFPTLRRRRATTALRGRGRARPAGAVPPGARKVSQVRRSAGGPGRERCSEGAGPGAGPSGR